MKKYTFVLVLLCIFLGIILYTNNIEPVEEGYSDDGFMAVSFIITYKYRIHNVIKYCSGLVDKRVAFSSEKKWGSMNKLYYDAAKLKDEHYITYIQEKYGADTAAFKKKEHDEFYLKVTDDFVNEYFAGIKDRHNIKNKCYSFIDELNAGIHNISKNEEIADDLRKLMLFVQMY